MCYIRIQVWDVGFWIASLQQDFNICNLIQFHFFSEQVFLGRLGYDLLLKVQ